MRLISLLLMLNLARDINEDPPRPYNPDENEKNNLEVERLEMIYLMPP